MTIAVGFRCVDGVVLAADSQYTEGLAKLYGQKIFPIPSNSYYALTIAGSGAVPSLKGIVGQIEEKLQQQIGAKSTSFSALKSIVEEVLRTYYPKHIDSAPKAKRDDLEVQLLVAAWVAGHGTRLFETYRTFVTEVAQHRSIGAGSLLVEFLRKTLLPPSGRPSVEVAKPLAAYMVWAAREFVQFCGGRTFVRALLNNGTDRRVWSEEIREAEEYFQDFFNNLAYLRRLLDTAVAPGDVDIGPYSELLKDKLVEFKQKQKTYIDRQDQNRIGFHPKQPA
jgi:20S proteasome alpha/beta subunit